MDVNHGWLDNLLFHPLDHQQQTFVTKHDLALLHKKIIATDLIVQKYQEANKALVGLQVENEQLRQQIEQITHECCIFGKQVTECTQECDHLKEEIEKLNAEKRQLHSDLRDLRDENTNYHHEVMVLKQYESLKEINDQSTKIIERQQKEIARLQLRAQRNSPVVYKPIRSSQEATETETALAETKKSVRELKLALGRLMNFLTNSKVEIPSSLRIRPVLKAHEINDDYLEQEGEYILQRPKRKSKRATQSAVVPDEKHIDNDNEDENDGFIDVLPAAATTTVPATSESASAENVKEILSLRSSSEPKKKRKKTSKSEVDDLAHELDMAIAEAPVQTHDETTSHLIDIFGEDVIELNSPAPLPPPPPPPITPAPVPFKQPAIPRTNSSITFTRRRVSRTEERPNKNVSFLSDEEDMDTQATQKPVTSLPSSPPLPPATASQPTPTTRSNEFRTSISFLSEDDDHETTPLRPQSPEFPPSVPEPTIERQLSQLTDELPSTPPSTIDSITPDQDPIVAQPSEEFVTTVEPTVPVIEQVIEPIAPVVEETVKPVSPPTQVIVKPVETIVPAKDPIRIDLVFRLLKVVTQVPVQLKPLRLCHRRIRMEKVAKKLKISQPPPVPVPPVIEERPIRMEKAAKKLKISQPPPVPVLPVIEERPIPMETHQPDEQLVETSSPIIESTPIVEEQLKPVEIENVAPTMEISDEKEISTRIEPSQELPNPMNKEIPSKPPPLSPKTVLIVSRLLQLLTTLPVPNAHYSPLYRQRKQKVRPISQAPSVISRPAVPLCLSQSSPPPMRMATRSLTSIRARIARCNRSDVPTRKRAAPDPIPTPPLKRLRSNTNDIKNDDSDRLKKFLQTFTKEINVDMKNWIEQKFKANATSFIDEFYRIVMDIFTSRANMILPHMKNLHPYEDSLKILVKFLDNQSKDFSSIILTKLKQSFEVELKQKTIVNQRLKILNRLYFLICSICLPTPTLIYTRLFDIGCSLSKDFLVDAVLFVQQHCSSINQKSSSNINLHRILFDVFATPRIELSFEYLEKLCVSYLRENGDQEDFIRSSILLCRHQTWSWCSQEFFLKLFFPLFNGVKENSLIFILLQNILFIFKDNEEFRQDRTFHRQLEQLLSSKTISSTDLRHRRDQILFILQHCS